MLLSIIVLSVFIKKGKKKKKKNPNVEREEGQMGNFSFMLPIFS